MEMPSFSFVVVCNNTKDIFFKDFLETVIAQNYDNWEMYILDDNVTSNLEKITKEFFPSDTRVHYRKIKNHKGKAYATNIGFHFAEGEYVFICNGQDRLDSHCLYTMADVIINNEDVEVIYSDHSDIEGTDITNIHIKQGLNKELLLRTNYIGNTIVVKRKAVAKVGSMREALTEAYVYEYLIRCMEKKLKFYHIPKFLYYRRISYADLVDITNLQNDNAITEKKATGIKGFIESIFGTTNKSNIDNTKQELIYKEQMASVKAYLTRNAIKGKISLVPNASYWKLIYDGEDVYKHSKDYILIRDKGVKVSDKHFLEKMYGFIKQNDVAVVGCRFAKPFWTVENSGYIYDAEGNVYPAFYNTKLRDGGYEDIQLISRDIGMVDGAFCMISKKAYRALNGFDSSLTGRDIMLDFCIRARAKGYRVVLDTSIVAKKQENNNVSSEMSHNILMDKLSGEIDKGDPFYSQHFAMGLNNHVIEEADK